MKSNFHESYSEPEVRPPSECSTGLLFAIIAVIVAILWHHSPVALWVSLCVAGLLASVSFVAPVLLRPINILWFKFGLLLHHVVSPIVMFLMFAIVFVPVGAIMRLCRDPLRKRRTPSASTHWIERKGNSEADSMLNQF